MRFGRLAAAQTSGTRGTEAFQPGARLASVAQHTQGERLCSILPVDRGSRAGDWLGPPACGRRLAQLEQCDGPPILAVLMMEHYLGHAWRQMDQVERRLLNGESIAHQEKVFSVFEEHTRWISKGKAGVAVELGVPVCIVERSVSVHCSSQDFMARRRCGCGGADGRGDAGAIFGFSHVQF